MFLWPAMKFLFFLIEDLRSYLELIMTRKLTRQVQGWSFGVAKDGLGMR